MLIEPKGVKNGRARKRVEDNLDDEINTFVDFQDGIPEEIHGNGVIQAAIGEEERHEAQFTEFTTAIVNKNVQVRSDALKGMCDLLSRNCIQSRLMEWQPRLQDCLEKCLKRSKDEEEQCLLVRCLMLAVIQLGSTKMSSDLFYALDPHLYSEMINPASFPGTRSTCTEALALGCLIIKDIVGVTQVLHELQRTVRSEDQLCNPQVLKSALSACSLLLTLAPVDVIYQFNLDNYDRLMQFLRGNDKQLRVTAGECFALVYECLNCDSNAFQLENSEVEGLKDELYKIDCKIRKHESSKKRISKKQHIRDILTTLEGDYRSVRVIKFSMQNTQTNSKKLFSLGLCDWRQDIRYCAYARVLGSSLTKHLAKNTEMCNILSYNSDMIKEVVKTPKHKKTKTKRRQKNTTWKVHEPQSELNGWHYPDEE